MILVSRSQFVNRFQVRLGFVEHFLGMVETLSLCSLYVFVLSFFSFSVLMGLLMIIKLRASLGGIHWFIGFHDGDVLCSLFLVVKLMLMSRGPGASPSYRPLRFFFWSLVPWSCIRYFVSQGRFCSRNGHSNFWMGDHTRPIYRIIVKSFGNVLCELL